MAEEKVWKPLELIKVSADYLAGKDVPNPRLDAEILLCEIMGLKRRVDLYAGFEREISGKELAGYRELIRRRSVREPVSRILGRREFMGLPFRVTPDVLSPRPETELLVEAAVEVVRPKKAVLPEEPGPVEETPGDMEPAAELMPDELAKILDSYAEDVEDADNLEEEVVLSAPARRRDSTPGRQKNAFAGEKKRRPITRSEPRVSILDLGTGSGCIAVSVAAQLPGAVVTAVDASPKALAVAKYNAGQAGVEERIAFRQGDWFAGCRQGERFDLILSNPPYLVEGDADIWPEVSRYDPPAALYGGQDGLDCYRRLIPSAPDWMVPGGSILLEVGSGQAKRVADLLSHAGFCDVETIRDYSGIERIVKGSLPV